ncbi:hypothetical protein AN2V17_19600 [Vallitalea sp. AN17-2]|uniref:Uncharacterized protein n=2 Tax=Vallitalea maricola TaxID=3074433 RepID=A0ACB5ULE3_9FIRM|nr:hypothetical protein AN2V17_19600 [Vallitalea sp. AN17-2]
MLFVGGLCGLTIGLINERTKLKIWQQCIIGTFIILAIEFIFGVILNIWLKLNIWNYDGIFANAAGQICLPYAVLWFFLIPTSIWLYQLLTYTLYNEEKPEKLISLYMKLFRNE